MKVFVRWQLVVSPTFVKLVCSVSDMEEEDTTKDSRKPDAERGHQITDESPMPVWRVPRYVGMLDSQNTILVQSTMNILTSINIHCLSVAGNPGSSASMIRREEIAPSKPHCRKVLVEIWPQGRKIYCSELPER